MLFQNLYEGILVRQKLKTKQENSLINSVYLYIFIINKAIVILVVSSLRTTLLT